jgi:hypothetical protein
VDAVRAFREDLDAYFSSVANKEARIGKVVLPKPLLLMEYEQVKTMGLSYWAGGLSDQGHIWIQFYRICENAVVVHSALQGARQNYHQENREDPALAGMPDWMKDMFE